MMPELREKPFNDERYIFEPKIDGHRLMIRVKNGIAQLCSRSGIDVTMQYPELWRVPVVGAADVLLDGVAAFFDESAGSFSSEALRERMRMRKSMDIRIASVHSPVHYFAFDILEWNGKDLRGLPLKQRKQLLEKAMDDNRSYHRMFALDAEGKRLYEAIRSEGVDGIIAKRLDSIYAGGRSENWLTVHKYRYAQVRIAGYRKHGFGWLLEREGQRIGIVEAGVPGPHRQAFQGTAQAILTGEDRDYVYVKPIIEAKIRFLSRTSSGTVRNPEFVRFVG